MNVLYYAFDMYVVRIIISNTDKFIEIVKN